MAFRLQWSQHRGTLSRSAGVALAVAALIVTSALPRFAAAAPSHSPFGQLDSAAFVNGSLRVSGWAIDPDVTAPIAVHVYIDGAYASLLNANQPRLDVARAYPRFGPGHGFSVQRSAVNGSHRVCAYAMNVGVGANTLLGCKVVIVENNPQGAITSLARTPGGLRLTGWTLDPNVTTPISAHIYVDSVLKSIVASSPVPGVGTAYPYYGPNHGFVIALTVALGTHRVCAYGMNVGPGTSNTQLGCISTTLSSSPFGSVESIRRTSATTMSIGGWAIDPDSTAPISARVTVDAVDIGAVLANLPRLDVARVYPAYGPGHGFTLSLPLDGKQHTACVRYVNVGAGADRLLRCVVIPNKDATIPGLPTNVRAWPGNASGVVGWTPPTSDGLAAISSYTVMTSPGGRSATVGSTVNQTTVTGLTNGIAYKFTVTARNPIGIGTGAVSAAVIPSPIPPQISAAPVSTSHYPRNWTGNLTNDMAVSRRMGATDASHDPSGHRYLILLDIGGQDEIRKGVLLSATSKFFSYAYVVSEVKAYLDGYVSLQKAYAPLVLALGTNNDVDVSHSAGVSWAQNVVNPLVTYAGRYPGVTIAGANDIEPGFSATMAESKAWVSGYLVGTLARYVFNGSADGCSTSAAGSRCNNGWTMADMQWVGGGAAPTRSINLPQIYNYAMPLQWKNISLTGVNLRRPKLYFGGPLTELSACAGTAPCSSLANVVAWSQLWAAISSHPATRQYDMPYGTDLQIN